MANEAQQISTVNPYVSAGIQTATGLVNNGLAWARESAQRKWVEKMTNEQREWDINMWNKTNEYNNPANQVARLQEAGLNPLYYGLDGQTAQGVSAASPVGMPNQGTQGIANPMEGYMAARLQNKQIELMNKNIDNIESEIRNREENTAGLRLDNEWKTRTLDARSEASTIANNLTKEQIAQVNEHKNLIKEQIKETIAKTENEIERKALIKAETWLKNASAQDIVEMSTYNKNLKEAQTAAQKAAAAASWANAAYQKGMIDEGYINAIVEREKANTKNSEAIAAANDFKQAVMNGTLFTVGERGFSKAVPTFLNNVFKDVSAISNAIGGGLSGILKP